MNGRQDLKSWTGKRMELSQTGGRKELHKKEKKTAETLNMILGRFTEFQLIKMQICTSAHGLILSTGGSGCD